MHFPIENNSFLCGRWKPQSFYKLQKQNDEKKSPHISLLVLTTNPG